MANTFSDLLLAYLSLEINVFLDLSSVDLLLESHRIARPITNIFIDLLPIISISLAGD